MKIKEELFSHATLAQIILDLELFIAINTKQIIHGYDYHLTVLLVIVGIQLWLSIWFWKIPEIVWAATPIFASIFVFALATFSLENLIFAMIASTLAFDILIFLFALCEGQISSAFAYFCSFVRNSETVESEQVRNPNYGSFL